MDTVPDPECRHQRRKRHKLLLVEVMQEFANSTSLHGLKYITEKGLTIVEKLFWVVTFLISISLCIVLIRNVWVKWQTSPVIVALSEQLVSVGDVPFPAVTICPQIKAKRSVYNFTHEALEMKKLMKKTNYSKFPLKEDSMEPWINKFEDVGLICWLEEPLVSFGERDFADSEVIENIMEVAPGIEDVFEGCRWRGTLIYCHELFKPVLTMEGICFTMNSMASSEIFDELTIQKDYFYLNTSEPSQNWTLKDGYTSSSPDVYPRQGRGNGWYTDLMVLLKEKTVDRDGMCYGINRGYKVYLQHPADMPQSSLYYYAALPKQTSSLALKFSIMNTSESLMDYPPGVRQCYFPEERQLKYFLSYTPKNCRLECLSEYTFSSCGCVWFHMPHNNSTTICRELKRHCVTTALDWAVLYGKICRLMRSVSKTSKTGPNNNILQSLRCITSNE